MLLYMAEAAAETGLLFNPHVPRIYRGEGNQLFAQYENGGTVSHYHQRAKVKMLEEQLDRARRSKDPNLLNMGKRYNSGKALLDRMNDPNEAISKVPTPIGGEAHMSNLEAMRRRQIEELQGKKQALIDQVMSEEGPSATSTPVAGPSGVGSVPMLDPTKFTTPLTPPFNPQPTDVPVPDQVAIDIADSTSSTTTSDVTWEATGDTRRRGTQPRIPQPSSQPVGANIPETDEEFTERFRDNWNRMEDIVEYHWVSQKDRDLRAFGYDPNNPATFHLADEFERRFGANYSDVSSHGLSSLDRKSLNYNTDPSSRPAPSPKSTLTSSIVIESDTPSIPPLPPPIVGPHTPSYTSPPGSTPPPSENPFYSPYSQIPPPPPSPARPGPSRKTTYGGPSGKGEDPERYYTPDRDYYDPSASSTLNPSQQYSSNLPSKRTRSEYSIASAPPPPPRGTSGPNSSGYYPRSDGRYPPLPSDVSSMRTNQPMRPYGPSDFPRSAEGEMQTVGTQARASVPMRKPGMSDKKSGLNN